MRRQLKLLFAGIIIVIAVPAILSTGSSTHEGYKGNTLNNIITPPLVMEGNVFYKHRHYFYWGPSEPRETINCGHGNLDEAILRNISKLDPLKWHTQFIHIGDITVKRFSKSHLSEDKLIRTTVTINAVLRGGKLLAFSKEIRNSPGPGAYTKVCTTLKNGTQSCRMELSAYDIDSIEIDEFTFYYNFEEYAVGCSRNN
jgi:hypothetical protein